MMEWIVVWKQNKVKIYSLWGKKNAEKYLLKLSTGNKTINGLFSCKIALYIYTHKNVYTHIYAYMYTYINWQTSSYL